MNTLGILIFSCDKYSDIWDPFFRLFFKYWPQCLYPVYLLTNQLKYEHHSVISLCIGEDRDWSSNARKALSAIQEKYLLIMMEDYFFEKEIPSENISLFMNYMEQENISYFRLFPCPAPNKSLLKLNGIKIGEIEKNEDYRVSLQAAIWKKDLFLKILKDGESAWEFEINGSARSREIEDRFMGVGKKEEEAFPYLCTAVVKGYWVKEAVDLCRIENIALNTDKRKVETFWIHFKRNFILIRFYKQSVQFCRKYVKILFRRFFPEFSKKIFRLP